MTHLPAHILVKQKGKHGVYKQFHKDGDTQDIINTVLYADKRPEHLKDTQELAKSLRQGSDLQTAYNIWFWVKKNIKYILDPLGEQYIKAPNKTLSDGFGDCKSRTLLITSLLANNGIKGKYRFAGYRMGNPVSHVYAVALIDGKEVILDPDMNSFNQQKKYSIKIDYNMSSIAYVAGLEDNEHREGMLNIVAGADGKITDLDMEVAIRKQRDEIQKNLLEGVAGVGCPHAEKIQNRIEAYKDIIEIRKNPNISGDAEIEEIAGVIEDYTVGAYNDHDDVAGIGDIGARKARRAAKKAQRKARRAKRKAEGKTFGQRLKKTVKKVAKGLLKLATAPQRLAAKGVLEVLLPKAAPFFIYLFVTKPELIAKLPAQAKRKRNTAVKIKNFIVNTIGMKEAHFMAIIRNGIMKRYKKSPEMVLKSWLGFNVSGVGVIPAAIIPVIIKIIQKLAAAFGKKKEGAELEADAKEGSEPDPKEDFATMSDNERKSYAKEVAKQPQRAEDKSVLDSDSVDSAGTSIEDKDTGTDPTVNTGSRQNKLC
jgi:hypothetical protein